MTAKKTPAPKAQAKNAKTELKVEQNDARTKADAKTAADRGLCSRVYGGKPAAK